MNNNNRHYWFPAKRYGYGWGLPATWQGWVVLMTWTAIFILGLLWLSEQNIVFFCIYPIAMMGILLAICYLKGEPAKWRWGDKD